MDRQSPRVEAVKQILACHDRWRRTCLIGWSALCIVALNVIAHFLTGWPGMVMRLWVHCTR